MTLRDQLDQNIETFSDSRADAVGCDRFMVAMKEKLRTKAAEGKYGWNNPDVCSLDELQHWLREHIEKGDPVDIANYCMMIWNRSRHLAPEGQAGKT